MNEVKEVFKNKVFQRVVTILLVFVVGLIVGYEMHKNGISYLQGYTYNMGDYYNAASASNASSSNASSSNASSSNASSANASSSNASTANASTSNASTSNASTSNASTANASGSNIPWLEEVTLVGFDVNPKTAKPGDTISAVVSYTGFWEKATILFKNKTTGSTFSSTIYSNTLRFRLPTNIMDGNYEISQVLFTGSRTRYSKYTKLYSKSDALNSFYFNFKTNLEIKTPTTTTETTTEQPTKTEEIKPITISSFKLDKSKAQLNEQVNVTYKTNKEITNMKLEFTSSSKDKMTVYVHSLSDKAYFEIPSTVKAGKYTLTSAVLTGSDVTTAFSNTKNVKDHTYYNFNTTLEITIPKVEEQTNFNYNNEDMNATLISNIYDAPDTSEITINANNSPVVNSEIFNSIKGTNKKLVINYNDNQYIFNGKDITDTSKSIDTSISVGRTNNDDDIKGLVSDAIVVYFGDNGQLPGKATVRIKVTDELKSLITGNKAYLYCYNEETKDFTYVETDIKEVFGGYYEFEVSHNSKYVLVNEKLSSSLLAKDTTESPVTRFIKDNTVYLILIIVAIMIIILVVVFLMIQKRKKN